MNQYNERWTREKFLEYRKLKRSGYTQEELINYFGDDIYESGMFTKNGRTLPYSFEDFKRMCENRLNEIKINPNYVYYSIVAQESAFFKEKTDYVTFFDCNEVNYILAFVYFPLNDKITYNIVFTTRKQWFKYEDKLKYHIKNNSLTNDVFTTLNDIITKETNLNDVFPVFKNITFVVMDFYNKYLKDELLSIVHGKNDKKINFYRDIIKNSFDNITEEETIVDDEKYYIYKIN